jgi:formiminoglutamase
MFKPSDLSLWKGRIDTDPAGDARRIHEVVRAYDDSSAAGSSVVLLGFCSDEGVRRNLGRVGAKDGPAAIRAALAPLAWRAGDTSFFDGGDFVCEGDQLEQLHGALSARVQELLSAGHLPIVLGGGHEVAFGTGSGVLAAYPAPTKIGIINIDAHLDLRTPPARNSGSSFADLAARCAEQKREFSYLCLGVSESSNSEALWNRAKSLHAKCFVDSFVRDSWAETRELCSNFIDCYDRVYLSIDMDVLPSYEAPGVSAPASLGVPFEKVLSLVEQVVESKKLSALDIAEVNPRFDSDHRTARLAAKIVHTVIHARKI